MDAFTDRYKEGKPTILVLDDHLRVLNLTALVLADMGALVKKVLVCGKVEEHREVDAYIDSVEAVVPVVEDVKPDVIILDYAMKSINAPMVIERLRAVNKDNIPIIVHSTVHKEVLEELLEGMEVKVIDKWATAKELKDLVNDVLGRDASRAMH